MRKLLASFLCSLAIVEAISQTTTNQQVQRPKLVVGIVVDQMRWDYLYRYIDRYTTNGGFKRLLTQGFSCENGFIPYAPTVTACGHTCIYTGSVPAIHGITGNSWWDRQLNRSRYCTQDDSVKTVGAPDGTNGKQSPRNMFTTTIADELRLATNFQSKVVGIAIKDRGGILPAGQSANAAYWFDGRNGNWITSTYYMSSLPQWVENFNSRKLADKYYAQGWQPLYPLGTYRQSTGDEQVFEGTPFGTAQKKFPYELKKFIGADYWAISTTPFGNSITLEFAKAAIEAESLGTDAVTDLLALSLSSTDYVGHSFGPNSIEVEDTYLRLDIELGEFFKLLDNKIGKGQWLVFLSADHGVAHIPGFMKQNKLPGGLFFDDRIMKDLNTEMKSKFGSDSIIVSMHNYQVHLNRDLIVNRSIDDEALKKWIINRLMSLEAVSHAFALDEMDEIPLPAKITTMIANGYHPTRSGDIQIILKPNWIDAYMPTGTTHGLWNPYDSHIPIIFYGWNIKPGKLYREVYMSDIAPTIAALLKIQMPNGCIGEVIEEAINKR